MYYDHIHLNRAGAYAFGTQLNTLLVQCSTRVVERTMSNKVRVRGQIFKKGGQVKSSPTLELPKIHPLLHVSSSMDNEPRCLVLEDQPLLHASSSMDNEPRCLVLEDQPLLHVSSPWMMNQDAWY